MVEKIDWDSFVKNVAEYLGLEENEINKSTNIYSDLGIDSLGLFSLGMFMIKTYGINFPMSTVSTINTIGDLFDKMCKSSNNLN